jgi:hypothetical protein
MIIRLYELDQPIKIKLIVTYAAADLFINMTSYFKYTIAITINIIQLCASE